MGTPVRVVSLGRLLADRVPLEPAEACAVLLRLWDHLAPTRTDNGALATVPSLDAVGITAFGDFEVRPQAMPPRALRRRPDEVARDMAALVRRLLVSGRGTLAAAPAQILTACRAHEVRGARSTRAGEAVAPALFEALAPYRPGDPSEALAMVFARWARATDGGTIRGGSDRSGA